MMVSFCLINSLLKSVRTGIYSEMKSVRMFPKSYDHLYCKQLGSFSGLTLQKLLFFFLVEMLKEINAVKKKTS